ncbi:hypothetical protein JMJ35_002515 [Cladonia borealis]|uniref:Uncharacterized protein n=1 Tax=Cladonia borealis TaxID=184061 RepID=A0AA39R7Z4_9LECA|nr:hypothetical protein JMJ35_002515 [Cladonia borealis]
MASSISTTSVATPRPLSLPLFKLSFCTALTPRSPMTWTHLPNRDGMFAVFDHVMKRNPDGVVGERALLKCVRGGELIEQIDLDVLQHQVCTDEARAGSQQLRDEDRIVIVLLKIPCLALRYQLPDGQIRKIQMNFLPTSGCEIAVNILRSIGIPIRDKSQPVMLQAVPESSQERPPSPSRLRPQVQTSAAGSTYDPNLPITQWSHMTPQPASTRHDSQSSSQRGLSNFDNASYGSVPQPSKSAHTLSRPTSATSGVNHDEASKPITFICDPRTDLLRSRSAHVNRYDIVARPYSSSAVLDSRNHPAVPPSLTSRLLPSAGTGSQSRAFGHEARPTSAPQSQTLAQHLLIDDVPLSQVLPPKRVLPFPESKAKPASGNDGAAAAEKQNAEPTACDKTKAQTAKGTKGRVNNARTKSSGRKASLPTPEPSSSAPKPRSRKKAVTKKDFETAPPSSAPPKATSPRKPSSREVSPISETAYPSSPPVAKTTKKRPLIALENNETNKRRAQVHEGPSSPPVERQKGPLGLAFSDMKPAELLDSLHGWIQKYHHLPAPEPPKTSKDHLAEYAKHSDEERAKAIDKLICDCLQDENFHKLVEDLEGTWKRIGLGF